MTPRWWAVCVLGVLVVALIGFAAVLIPLAWFGLPRRIRGVGTAYVAAAICAPLGLIAPGFAFGEGGAEDLQHELGYEQGGMRKSRDKNKRRRKARKERTGTAIKAHRTKRQGASRSRKKQH